MEQGGLPGGEGPWRGAGGWSEFQIKAPEKAALGSCSFMAGHWGLFRAADPILSLQNTFSDQLLGTGSWLGAPASFGWVL